MGNRGVLHNDRREIVRQYANRRWISCLLEFKSRRRVVMTPNRYTELFFLDEAVALAAGHRPCAECCRERFEAFREALRGGRGERKSADEIDTELHRARIDARKQKVTHQAQLDSLPDGCFIEIGDLSYLVWANHLLQWSPEGYIKKLRRKDHVVTVLTPKPTVECLRHRYRPEVHPSALD